MENRTILLGLDGGTFSILDGLMENGVMPFLKSFMESGVRGKLMSTIPPITPTAWTSMMTGRTPGNHGIFDFFRFESPNSRYVRFISSRNIACETIWSIANRQNLRVTSLNFPVMVPIRPINGFIVPGWVPERHIRRGCHPRNLYERLNKLPGISVRELAMDPVIDRAALAGCPDEECQGWIEHHTQKEQKWFEVLCYLMKEEPCHLTAILFDCMDKLEHLFWRFISPELFPEEPSPFEQKIRNLCLDYFRQLDNNLAQIVSLSGPETRVFMVSDHGFGPTFDIFYLNTWLHKNGYLEWVDDVKTAKDELDSQDPRVILPKDYTRTLDWSKTTAHCLTASSNAIHISVAGQRGEEGISPEDYESFRKKLIESLCQVTNEAGEPMVRQILTREEAFPGSQLHLAPDLTLVLKDYGFISTLRSNVIVKPRPEPVGIHYPEGIFAAAGPGIRKELFISELSIPDVTPTLLYSLGLPVPEDMEGDVPVEIFEPDFIKAYPVQVGEPTQPVETFQQSDAEEMDAEGKAKILARLKALGYVD